MNKIRFSLTGFLLLLVCGALQAQTPALPKTKMIELGDKRLDIAGLKADRNTVEFREIRQGSEKRMRITTAGFEMRDLGAKEKSLKPKAVPRLCVIAGKPGSSAYFRDLDDYKKAVEQKNPDGDTYQYTGTDELIAVHTVIYSKAKKNTPVDTFDVYLWFEPTAEFKDALDEKASKEISEEKTNPPSDSTYAIENKPVSVKNVSLYPNPVTQSYAILDFELTRPAVCSIIVTDIRGNVVHNAMTDMSLPAERHNSAMILAGLPQGMYLVTLVIDNRETVTERLVLLN